MTVGDIFKSEKPFPSLIYFPRAIINGKPEGIGEVSFQIETLTGKIIIDKRSQEQKDEMFEKFGIPK